MVPYFNNPQEMSVIGQQIHTHGHVLDGGVMNVGDTVKFDNDNYPAPENISYANDNIEQVLGDW